MLICICTRGGISGTLEGFYFGIPLIALPSYGPNYQIVTRLAEQGVALNLPIRELTARMIRENVERVLQDDRLRDRLRHMQHVVRSSGGSVTAVDRIEQFLVGRS